ncbi:MAG: FAD-dependent oxidoreductase, partial [Gammaproteobacteria bacterium]|nr:FAD-dependent oxidoreductase [Gammaproteobacteria bacterium]
TPRLIQTLWEPLVLGALNTPLHEASTQLFMNVLRDSFRYKRADSDLLFPTKDLGNLFATPVRKHIEALGSSVSVGTKVMGIRQSNHQTNNQWQVETRKETLQARHLILAVPPHRAHALICPLPLPTLAQRLQQFDTYPITTIYLQFDTHITLPEKMIGFSGGHAQWLFHRSFCQQEDLVAIIISGPGSHMEMDKQTLTDIIVGELKQHYPHLPDIIHSQVIREKRATFRATAGIDDLRPENQTELNGLWLAGDYTRGPYPATLEGAVQSGVQCARQIIKQLSAS